MAALTSYVGVSAGFFNEANGVLGRGFSVRLQDITDGTSETVMVGERPPAANLDTGRWYTNHPSLYYPDFVLPAEDILDPFSKCDPPLVREPDGTLGYKFVFGPGRIDNQCDEFHYWSLHPGGANFAFADGSVRFLAYSVSPLLRALATRNGGEVVDVP